MNEAKQVDEGPAQRAAEVSSAGEAGAGPRRGGEPPAGGAARADERAERLDDADVRARPGRRTVEERHRAVLEVLGGKASVDQVARRLGVLPETVEGWRQDALGGIDDALRRGSGKTPRELELEREVEKLKRVVTTTAIEKCLLQQALDIEREKRPTGPARSRR